MLPEGVELEQSGAVVTVQLRLRDVTHLDLQEVVVECQERMRYSNARHFLFDLEGVEFLSSACVGVLVGFLQEVEHMRGRIALVHCEDNVAFLFKVTRLDHVFPIYDDVTEAAAAL